MMHLNRMKHRVAAGTALVFAAAGLGLAVAYTPAQAQSQTTPDSGHAAPVVVEHLVLGPMPEGSVTTGNGAVQVSAIGLTPGSAHLVVLKNSSRIAKKIGTLTADGSGVASATFAATISAGARLEILDGKAGTAPIATTPVGKVSNRMLQALEPGRSGSIGGFATLVYNPNAHRLTVTLTAGGLSPGSHAAHIHVGSCINQGPIQYMLQDFNVNRNGIINHEVRVVTDVTSTPPASGWYLNLHQGTSTNIVNKNGNPTIFFRPLLCAELQTSGLL